MTKKERRDLLKVGKRHTGLYLPVDLLRRVAQYQLDKTGTAYGRNAVVIRAIEEFLKREGY